MSGEEHRGAAASWALGVVGVLTLAALAVSLAFPPDSVARGAPAKMLGLTPRTCPGCPLCGMSRAFSAVSHLQPALAFDFNRGVVLAYPLALVLAFGGPALLLRHLVGKRSPWQPPRSRS
jgi:hypothetical protein